ncbi:MAG: serine/threonine-protein phosphatase [Pseudobutyrivibrio sp.]|nr:serine/threonine-protein phosphatase [Pseudobutyrivibrio sp.]
MKKFNTDAITDIGIKKSVNQDALLIKQAHSASVGDICFGCLCDGMGGLSAGEIASSALVHRMDEWFRVELPGLLSRPDFTESLAESPACENIYLRQVEKNWDFIVNEMNIRLQQYGLQKGIRIGTTIVAILVIENDYIIMNVGDSRAYRCSDVECDLLTHDHSYVQKQMDMGRMTKEEAKVSDKKSVLLQCVGASEQVVPSFYYGKCGDNNKYLLCSDGLWRRMEEKEILNMLKRKQALEAMTNLVKERGETDNISGLVIAV